jgi:endonuclease III
MLDQWVGIVRAHAEEYRHFVTGIAPVTPGVAEVYERYLFALLSRHCELGRTVRAFGWLRGRYQADVEAIAATLRDGRIGFYNTWPPQIAAFTRAYLRDPECFLPAPGEPFPEARERIARQVTGLGPAKTAFALGLISPLAATVCCVDTHIARLVAPLMGCPAAAVPSRYREAESLLQEIATGASLPLVPAHWILWDHQRDGRIDAAGSESVRLIGPLFRTPESSPFKATARATARAPRAAP